MSFRYLCKYLESLGVTPTRQTLEKARLQLPQDELKISAAWKSDTVTVSPLERAAVMSNNKLHAAAAKARFKESRAAAERRKVEREAERAEEKEREDERRRGRRKDKAAPAATTATQAPTITTTAPSSPSRPRLARSRLTSTRPVASIGGGVVAGGGLALTDVVSSVLRKQEDVFEAMRVALDHRRRMGDRDEEVEAFWSAARTASDEAEEDAANANNAAANTTPSKVSPAATARRSDADEKEGDGAADGVTSSVDGSGGGAGGGSVHAASAPVLQVFTLHHFLRAHSFATQTRRGAIMALEESSIAGENVLKKKVTTMHHHHTQPPPTGTTDANATAATPVSPSAGGRRTRAAHPSAPIPMEMQVLYWRPKVTEAPATLTHAEKRARSIAAAIADQQVASHDAINDAPLSATTTQAHILHAEDDVDFGFGPTSRSFAALAQLYHHPFHAEEDGQVRALLRAFFRLFPRYRTGLERSWSDSDAVTSGGGRGAGENGGGTATKGTTTLAAPPTVGGGASDPFWSAHAHNEFGLVRGEGGAALLGGGGVATGLGSTSSGVSVAGDSSQPSKLQAFYADSDFRSLHAQAASLLTTPRLAQLVGLIGHYLYWTEFAAPLATMRRLRARQREAAGEGTYESTLLPVEPVRLGSDDIAMVRLALQRLHAELDDRLRRLRHYALFFLPLLLDLLGTCVLALFHAAYPLWFASQYGRTTDQRLLRAIETVLDAHLLSAVPNGMPGAARHLFATNATNVPSSTETGPTLDESTSGASAVSSSVAGGSSGGSLFFRTSDLVRRAFPQPDAEGARLLRKADVARRWRTRLHAQQVALASKNEERRRKDTARVEDEMGDAACASTDAAISSTPPSEGLLLHTRESLLIEAAARDAVARARAGGSFSARRFLESRPPLPPATARDLPPLDRSNSTREPAAGSRTARSVHTPRAPNEPAVSSVASSSSSSSRARLFDLALSKIARRHARDGTSVRDQVARPPGLAFHERPSSNATPTLAMHHARRAAETARERKRAAEQARERAETRERSRSATREHTRTTASTREAMQSRAASDATHSRSASVDDAAAPPSRHLRLPDHAVAADAL